jgi:hypothetical protein
MKAKNVELTLEETGWLCHLLLADLLRPVPKPSTGGSFLYHEDIIRAVINRKSTLYKKLADANDELMGK